MREMGVPGGYNLFAVSYMYIKHPPRICHASTDSEANQPDRRFITITRASYASWGFPANSTKSETLMGSISWQLKESSA